MKESFSSPANEVRQNQPGETGSTPLQGSSSEEMTLCEFCKAPMHKGAIVCSSCGHFLPEIQKASSLRLQLNLIGIIPMALIIGRFISLRSRLASIGDICTDPLILIGIALAVIVCILAEIQGSKVRRMKKGKYW
jgi:hypothetical protein